jgi:uncharacterized BrkB/YihY/UPF0761 family membrane protein
MQLVLGLADGGFQLLVALVPVAIWQRTRIAGFLLVAAGLALSAVATFSSQVLFRMLQPESIDAAVWGLRLLAFTSTALVGVGFVLAYLAFRRVPPAGT